MHNIILTAVLLILGSASASAQFYTITKEKEILPEKQQKMAPDTLQRSLGAYESCKKAEKDSLALEVPVKPLSELYARKVYARVSHEKELPALTIPKTGKYYEFNHWTESVRAYYTKLQYRYGQKSRINSSDVDYLKWLRDIGYAEDPRYIQTVVQVMKQHL